EHGGRRHARLHHQPAGLALLRAGLEPDPGSRPCRVIRSLRDVGYRATAVLPARTVRSRPACGPIARLELLEPQHRPWHDGVHEPRAGGYLPGGCLDLSRVVVRTLARGRALASHGDVGVAPGPGRYRPRRRWGVPQPLRAASVDPAALGSRAARPRPGPETVTEYLSWQRCEALPACQLLRSCAVRRL